MLTLITTPIGNINEVSNRLLETISSADLFLCEDTRVSKKLIFLLQDRYNITIQSSDFISLHSHNEEIFIDSITPEFFLKKVVYMSDAGTPCVSDPASLLVDYCHKNNIDVDLVGLNSSLIYAYALSGFSDKSFLFYGFLPHHKSRDSELAKILSCEYTTIIFEAPTRIIKLLKEICEIDNSREIFLAKELSKKFQTTYRGSAKKLYEELNDKDIRGEWIAVIKGAKITQKYLTLSEPSIKSLNIDKKSKSKLLSKVTNFSSKEWYTRLLEEDNLC